MTLVYLAGRVVGKTHEEARNGWRREARGYLASLNIKVLSPLRNVSNEIGEGVYTNANQSNVDFIVERDLLDIKRSDAVLANYLVDEQCPMIGTSIEVGYAFALGKPVVIMATGEMAKHPFFMRRATAIVRNLLEAVVTVDDLLSDGV